MDFKDKKIAILGLGEENVALTNFILEKGALDVTLLDEKTEQELTGFLSRIQSQDIKTKFGENYLQNLSDFELVFRTPGIHYLHPEIQLAQKNGTEISSQTKLFFSLCPCPIVGVTGTKGKGTTSTLIYKILKAGGKDVFLGGNIGNAPIEFLNELESDSLVVLELSSFQLQDLKQSPHIGVVLNISSDHLDVHKSNEEYIEAKTHIIAHQNKEDFACINADYLTSVELATQTEAQVYWFSRNKSIDQGVWVKDKEEIIWQEDRLQEVIIKTKEIFIRGEHNWENVSAAILATKLLNIPNRIIAEEVRNFPGLEHRLEFVVEHRGVKYFNDSFSTNPDTAIAAIKSFTEPILLIAGGSEKHADYKELGKAIDQSNVKTVILIGETGPRIKSEIKNPNIELISNCQNIDEVIKTAQTKAVTGDIVLLSPASASFDWFLNYKDRGKKFKDAILRKF